MHLPDAEEMRKLACFVALSLIAHFVVVYGVRLELPRRDAGPSPLQARLQPAALPPSAPMLPQRQAFPAKSRTKPVVAAPGIAPAPVVDPAPPVYTEPAVVAAAPPVIFPPAIEEPPPVIKAEPVAPAEPAPARRLPRKGEITYVVYLGTDKFSVGQTSQTWEINQDDTYRLTSVSETTGLVALFRQERRAYESVGKLTAGGLRPESFANQRVRSGRSEDAKASFDWNTMTVTVGRRQEQKSLALPADAQDLMSFMYQLGLRPLAPGRIEVPITNGWKLERYVLDVGSEEFLQTPFGTLRALPVKQVRRAGEESIELWLATEYRLLPVKIRFFDRQGEPSGEQSVSDIRVSDD